MAGSARQGRTGEDHTLQPRAHSQALMGIVGLWKDRTDLPDTETYLRTLRDDDRLERLESE